MRNGYIICGLAHDAAHIVLATEGLPPRSITTTDWSQLPPVNVPSPIEGSTLFLLRVPGSADGLFRSAEQIMDAAGVYREGADGSHNHRLLLEAIGKVRRGAADRVAVDFTLSPERLRLRDLDFFQWNEAGDWAGYLGCLADPGCAEVLRRGC